MNKKELKMYETPAVEVVEMEVQGAICAISGDGMIEDSEGGNL